MRHAPIKSTTEDEARAETIAEAMLKCLPPLPGWLPEINLLLAASPVDLRKVVRSMRAHPWLCTQLIRFCNSAVAESERVLSIEEAVVLLGTDRLRGFTLISSLREYAGRDLSNSALRSLWQHSLLTAGLTLRVARAMQSPQVESAYLAGLIHDIGLLPLLLPARGERAGAGAEGKNRKAHRRQTPGQDSPEREREVFGTDHCRIGRLLGASWNLPGDLLEVLARHHERRPVEHGELVRMVAVADRFCRIHALGSKDTELVGGASTAPSWSQVLAACLPELDAEERNSLTEALDSRFRELLVQPDLTGAAPLDR